MINEDEFNKWKESEVTKTIFKIMNIRRKYHEQDLLNPALNLADNLMLAMGENIGRMNMIDDFLEMAWGEIEFDSSLED